MEIGSFEQFFSLPYSQYSYLTTITRGVQIWSETEPFGLVLRPSKSSTWIPTPAASNDQSLMEIIVNAYNSSLSYMINRCQMYLNIVSLYDLLLFDKTEVHQSFIYGQKPPSRVSSLYWPDFPYPPRHYWIIWQQFIFKHIRPLLSTLNIQGCSTRSHTFTTSYFKHVSQPHLYRISEGGNYGVQIV